MDEVYGCGPAVRSGRLSGSERGWSVPRRKGKVPVMQAGAKPTVTISAPVMATETRSLIHGSWRFAATPSPSVRKVPSEGMLNPTDGTLLIGRRRFIKSPNAVKFMAADDTLGAFINDLFAGAEDEVPLQEFRRGLVHKRMKDIASAANRAAGLVMGIIRKHEDRMQFDDEFQLVIAGRLAIYRVDINAFINKFVNPFDYNSFDVVEVHPKSGLVNEPKTALYRFSRRRTCQHAICWPATSLACSTTA